jgi:hypothetical protein
MKKILHRIFFNFDDTPDPFLPYLKTWREQLPDFEIMQWDKNNLPLDLNAYTTYMAETRNHAFLSDYFRCWLLTKYSGMYLDADIEILDGGIFRKIYEEAQEAADYTLFIGVESERNGNLTAHSMGVKNGESHELLLFLMNLYEHVFSGAMRYFIKKNPIPDLMSLYFRGLEDSEGYSLSTNGYFPGKINTVITKNVKIYSQDYFSPVSNYNNEVIVSAFSENTCICHHFAATWRSSYKNSEHGKLFAELLKDSSYTIHPDVLEKLRERYPALHIVPHRPLWALSEKEIFKLERFLNKFIPYGSLGYTFLRKLRK